jgi:hypothetical protein
MEMGLWWKVGSCASQPSFSEKGPKFGREAGAVYILPRENSRVAASGQLRHESAPRPT